MILRIKSSPTLEREIGREVREKLRKRRRESPEYATLWRRVLERRPPGMALADYLRFRVLHRQFGGKHTPFLPSAVRVARYVVRRVPRLRKQLES